MYLATIMLLGAGELGREVAIAAKRLGCRVIACDRYDDAPAMQVADVREIFSMLDGAALRKAVEKHRPDHIVPEIEAIDTDMLATLEQEGWHVVPSAKAVQLTMNRDGIRDFAARELGLTTSRYIFAETREQAMAADVGLPAVVKPVMSSSGKGQSVAPSVADLGTAFDYAVANMRGDRQRVIVEEYIDFDYEITLLTVATKDGILFCPPIGHRQEQGDYRTSWQPAAMDEAVLRSAQEQAAKVVTALGGHGLFGVEFFVSGAKENQQRAIFSELSPRPHDTGMVTLIGQSPNEFELHVRAILGLPIPALCCEPAAASAVILADRASNDFAYEGLAEAMAEGADVRLFAKPTTLPNRRMGVALAVGADVEQAVARAQSAAGKVRIIYS